MNIEKMGINAVSALIDRTDYLISHCSENDKTPSWDGTIEVYRKAGDVHAKCDLEMTVPIQVKTHRSSNLKKKSVTFSVEIADMQNFLTIGGTVFFVVYIDDDGENSKIYYKELLPFELKKILKKYGTQKSKRLKFELLPIDKIKVTNIFLNIAMNMKKQKASIYSDTITIDELIKSGELTELSLGFTTVDKAQMHLLDYLFDHGTYLYADLPYGIKLPVEYLQPIESAKTTINAPVSVNGVVFYNKYDLVYKKDCVEMHFGKSSKLITNYKDNSLQFTFTLSGYLSDRIADEEFVVAILENKKISIDQNIYDFSVLANLNEDFDLSSCKEQLIHLRKVKKVLDILHVQEDLDCDNLTEKDENDLYLLEKALLDNINVPLGVSNNVWGRLQIGNLKMIICALCQDETKQLYKLCDFNTVKLNITARQKDGTHVPSTIYMAIQKESFLSCCNIDYSEMVRQIKLTPISEAFTTQVVMLILRLLSAYDESNDTNEKILVAAIEIAEWLKGIDPYTPKYILELNYYQAIKRFRTFTKEEKRYLQSMVEGNVECEQQYVGAYLLLDDQDAAEMHFDNMNTTEQNEFRDYPIFYFWNKNTTLNTSQV